MRHWIVVALVVLMPLGALAQDQENPDCIEVRAIARWAAAAYNHYVQVENGCEHAATCQVSTNVNREVQTVRVPAGGQVEVLTYRGSPAREFTPIVDCTLDD